MSGGGNRRFGAVLACAWLLAACGGGGGGGASPAPGGGGGGSGSGGPTPPTPATNRPPVLARANADQAAVQLHAFRYDPTQGGTTFSDPDGDALTYSVKLGHVYNPDNDPDPPPGLRVDGHVVTGAPQTLEIVMVTISASDALGQTASDQFRIVVSPNSPPAVRSPNEDLLVDVGGFVNIEPTKSGTVLADADGDAIAYAVTLRGAPRGLAVNGTRVSGVFDSIGLVEVTVTGRDAYGGVGRDVFLIAAPAPEPGAPTLPDPGYVYRDEELDLPFVFRLSSESALPLWDSQPADNRTSNAGAALGRVLFHDRRLSITNTVACASCHLQSHGFSTPDRFSTGALGVPLKRNTMALANARYSIHDAWFSDMRMRSLEELVLQPILDPEELGGSLELLESKLRATEFYPPLFAAAFGTPEITSDRVARALAQFVRSLLSYRTKFDRAFNPMFNGPGDPAAVLSAEEMRGFQIFDDNGRGRCNLCHELRGGANEWQANNGLDVEPTDLGTLDAALQRTGALGVFRAASLRNIAVTAPYMHDGRFATLRDVIDHYDHGVRDSPHLDPMLREGLYGPPIRLNLSEEDKAALEAFLRTMTDAEMLADPKFSDPFD